MRAPTFAIGDLYPEAKGPAPSTAQLGNPHEVAAASGTLTGMQLATVPSLNPRDLMASPMAWLALALAALFVLGIRR